MAEYLLSAKITAEIASFQKGMSSAIKSSGDLSKATDMASGQVSRNIANINKINLNAFNSALKSGQLSVTGLSKTSAMIPSVLAKTDQAVKKNTQGYMNLNRVLQDLPYGINGIANNLQQLIPGVGLASVGINLLLTAVTFANVGFGAWTRGIGDNKKALDNSKKASEDYANALNDVDQAQLRGAQNAQKEVIELKTLYDIAVNTSLAYKQRRDAVDELQKQYPSYFKNLSDESILAGGAASKYNELKEAIIATSRARAAQDMIVKNSSRQLENEQKIVDLEKQQVKNQSDLAKARLLSEASREGTSSLTGGTGNVVAARQLFNATQQVEETQQQINNLKTDTNILDKRNLDLVKSINVEIKKGADLAGSIGGITSETTVKPYVRKLDNIGKTRSDFMDPTFAYRQKTGIKALLEPLNDYQSGVQAFEQNLTESQQRAIAKMLEFNSAFQESIETLGSDTVVSGIANGFTSIGEALYNGANIFDAAGQAILTTVSDFLGQLGQMLIQKGVATVAAGTALNFLAPGSGAKEVAGGLGLIAAGAALSLAAGVGTAALSGNKKQKSNITAFATGAIISGPTLGLMGEYSGAKNNPEVVAPLSKLKGLLNVNNSTMFQLIPIVDSKGIAILAKNGNEKLNRQ